MEHTCTHTRTHTVDGWMDGRVEIVDESTGHVSSFTHHKTLSRHFAYRIVFPLPTTTHHHHHPLTHNTHL